MTLTDAFSRLHKAFVTVAAEEKIVPFAARILLAVDDAGGAATTAELNVLLHDVSGGSQIRRELLTLYRAGLVEGKAVDGRRRRRGIVTRVTLTKHGRNAVQKIRHYASSMAAVA